ncbi:DZANK-type domain-containing protein OS=Lysinibacillus sphaericus OX=1421 GN=LS41612_00550 PE=4 SV=1 [Lysinibacillus sphaericus]
MLVVSFILTLITLGLSSFMIHLITDSDAVLIANKKRQGKQVGKWEFFKY